MARKNACRSAPVPKSDRQAPELRDAARALVAAGGDPSIAKQERELQDKERRGLTFETQAQAHPAKTRKEGLAETTVATSEWLLGMARADFGAKPMSEMPTTFTTSSSSPRARRR